MQALLTAIGIQQRNIRTSAQLLGSAYKTKKNIDKAGLVKKGLITPAFAKRGTDAEIANGITHAAVLEAIAHEPDLAILVTEDDIAPSSYRTPQQVSERIQLALKHLKACRTCVMFYLEYCHEVCDANRTTPDGYSIMHAPACSAAILFRPDKVHEILKRIYPIDGPIDDAYRDMIKNGSIAAHGEDVFYQDEYFGSDAERGRGTGAGLVHARTGPLCNSVVTSDQLTTNRRVWIAVAVALAVAMIAVVIAFVAWRHRHTSPS